MITAYGGTRTAAHELTRGQWQAHVGSELFGDYYEMLTEQTPPGVFVAHPRNSPEGALIHLGRESAQLLVSDSRGTRAEALLVAHQDELFTYTDVEELRYVGESVEEAVVKHTTDGLEFAHAITMGVVVEAIRSARLKAGRKQALECADAVLRNPDSEMMITELATTGFEVIGSDHAPIPGGYNVTGLEKTLERIGVPYRQDVVRLSGPVTAPADFAAVEMRLRPDISAALRKGLAAQNHHVRTGDFNEMQPMKRRHAGKPGFSSGCPVAHNGRTFALMRQYLGECARQTAEAF